jgi:hypothetical protein
MMQAAGETPEEAHPPAAAAPAAAPAPAAAAPAAAGAGLSAFFMSTMSCVFASVTSLPTKLA